LGWDKETVKGEEEGRGGRGAKGRGERCLIAREKEGGGDMDWRVVRTVELITMTGQAG
jgi:hypothetical protein